MLDPQALETELLEIIGHLGAALIQSVPEDDQIIMGHVRDAHTLACALRRQINAKPPLATPARVVAIGDHDPELRRQLHVVAAEMGAEQ
jgi:hypothetical protein